MHSSKQEIVLLGLIIERPAAVEKVALMPRVREGDREACLREERKIFEVRINFRKAEAAPEAPIANEQKPLVPFGGQAQFEVHLVGPRMYGSHVAKDITVRNRIGLSCSRDDRGVWGRNRLNDGLGTVHGSQRSGHSPRPEAKKKSRYSVNFSQLTVHDRPPHVRFVTLCSGLLSASITRVCSVSVLSWST